MAYVAVFELLSDAVEDTSVVTGGLIGMASCGAMMVIQGLVKETI
jgi:hypothetical protein